MWLILTPFWITAACGFEAVLQGSCRELSDVPCQQICIDRDDGTFECACQQGYTLLEDGVSCLDPASKLKLDFRKSTPPPRESTRSTQLQYDGLRFGSNSYLSLPAPDSAYLDTNVTIEFKSEEDRDGLLFYAGQTYGRDFISLALIGQNLVLRFDCGEGVVEDDYAGPFESLKWHRINLKRHYCSHSEIRLEKSGITLVDDAKGITHYKGISISKYFYLGGIPEDSNWVQKTATNAHFHGCIRYFKVNEVVLLDSKKGINAEEESHNLERCAVDPCDGGPCPSGLTCKNFAGRPTCIKEAAKTQAVHTPQFAGESWIKHSAPTDFKDSVDLTVRFQPSETSGLIFYAGNATLNQYVALYLNDAYMHFQFDLGSGSSVLRSELQVSTRLWHKVEAWRSGRGGLLKVDGQPWVEGIAPAGFSLMLKSQTVYLGGAPDDVLPAAVLSAVQHGFHGCIQKASLNDQALSTITDALSAVNIRECGSNPCATRPCGARGDCTVYHDNYLCLCPFPATGDHCQNTHRTKMTSIGLRGSGFLKFSQRQVMKHITGDRMDVSIQFRLRNHTRHPYSGEQVLLFSGQETKGGDFIKIQLTNEARVQVILDLGSGPVSLTHTKGTLRDNAWHTASIRRTTRTLSLSVDDGATITTSAPEGSTQLNVYDALYIGGYLPKHGLFPNSGLRGCIDHVMLSSSLKLANVNQATEAVNVGECAEL